MAKWIRERIDPRGPRPEDRGQKADDGHQPPGPKAVRPNHRTCDHCVYAHWMRLGPSVLLTLDWLQHLMCVNHAETPGAFREVLAGGTCPHFRARREPPVRTEPPEPPSDEVKYIALTKGKHALVDTADFERLNRHKWCAMCATDGSGYYAVRRAGSRTILMHREIMNAPDDLVVDHIARNGLNNRRCNLRLCTPLENMYNRRVHSKSSRFQGVRYLAELHKWGASVKIDGRGEHIGVFADEVEAAKVRDRWAFAFHRRFAYLNFPADFEGKDPNDPEFQTLRDQLAEKRRRREEKKRAKGDKGQATRDK